MVVQVRIPRVQPRGVRVREYDGLSGLVGFTTARAYSPGGRQGQDLSQ